MEKTTVYLTEAQKRALERAARTAGRSATLDLLTLDERHFRVVAGPHGRSFRLLPADG